MLEWKTFVTFRSKLYITWHLQSTALTLMKSKSLQLKFNRDHLGFPKDQPELSLPKYYIMKLMHRKSAFIWKLFLQVITNFPIKRFWNRQTFSYRSVQLPVHEYRENWRLNQCLPVITAKRIWWNFKLSIIQKWWALLKDCYHINIILSGQNYFALYWHTCSVSA